MSSSSYQPPQSTQPMTRPTSLGSSSQRYNDSNFLNDLVLIEEQNYEDIIWSLWSNFFFVGGGMFDLVGSLWDLELASLSNDAAEAAKTMDTNLYHLIWILGPLVYLINSLIDVSWALTAMARSKRGRVMKRFYNLAHQHAANVGNEGDTGQDIQLALEKFERHQKYFDNTAYWNSEDIGDAVGTTTSGGHEFNINPKNKKRDNHNDLLKGAMLSATMERHYIYNSSNVDSPKSRDQIINLRRLRRHFGHRRDLSSATMFGLAAVCGLWSAIGDATATLDESLVDGLETVSIHLYLLSAVFALVGRKTRPPLSSNEEAPTFTTWTLLAFLEDTQALEDLGDTFFGVASIIDVLLCDLSFDDDTPWWPVVSAIFWLVDALLYLRGDFVAMYRNSTSNASCDGSRMERPEYVASETIGID